MSCQGHLKHVFRDEFTDPFRLWRSIPVHSGAFRSIPVSKRTDAQVTKSPIPGAADLGMAPRRGHGFYTRPTKTHTSL